jgi:hypothetical protein
VSENHFWEAFIQLEADIEGNIKEMVGEFVMVPSVSLTTFPYLYDQYNPPSESLPFLKLLSHSL